MFLTSDPGRVLVRRGFALNSRRVLLSLVDGAELATMPAGSAVVLDGAGVASCEFDRHPLDNAATIVVTPTDGSPARRIPTVNASCEEFSDSRMLSTNSGALIDKTSGRSLSDHGTMRIIDLSTGEPYEVDAPLPFSLASEQGFVIEPNLALLPSRPRPTALLARGSSLLWLSTTPAPPVAVPGERVTGMNDRFRVVRTDEGFFTSENGTGRRLGEVSVTHDPLSRVGIEEHVLWYARPAAGGWEVTQHELPSLRTINRFLAPSRAGAAPVGDGFSPPAVALERAFPEDGGLLCVIGDGVLTAWDPGSAQPAGPPITLGATERQTAFHRSFPDVHARPGHPGQVAVPSNTDVTLWDAVHGRLLATLPARADIETAIADDSTFGFDLGTGTMVDVPVTAQAWHDALCAVTDRPFTPAERDLLPPGTSTDPPC